MKRPSAAFTFVGNDDLEHACRVDYGWLGSERYFVDNQLIHQGWALYSSDVSFVAHGVTVEVHTKVGLRSAVLRVNIDGRPTHENLLSVWYAETKASIEANLA